MRSLSKPAGSLALGLALLLVAPACCAAQTTPSLTIVSPADHGRALVNPGMGWALYFYSNVPGNYGSKLEYSDTVDDFPGVSTVYLRIPWAYLEPQEGRFCWSVLDGPAQRWIRKGKKIGLRLTVSETWMRYATPEWVKNAGAKGYDFVPGKGIVENGDFWEPDYDDPVLLEKLDRFLAAAAARYDGNPDVAFVDVGTFGVWGEAHTLASTLKQYPASTVRKHVDLHLKHFRKSLLAANDDFVFQGDETMVYAKERGLAFRDDSILVQPGKDAWYHDAMASDFSSSAPVILEHDHLGNSKLRNAWGDGSRLLEAVEKHRASYLSIHWWPRELLAENRAIVDRINRRLGYRIVPTEASWNPRVDEGSTFTFSADWKNAGVAPCLPGGFPAVTLKDAKGGIAAVFAEEGFDVRDLTCGPPEQAQSQRQRSEFLQPFNLKPGRYDVFVSIGSRTGTPTIELPLENGDGEKRYRLGEVEVTER